MENDLVIVIVVDCCCYSWRRIGQCVVSVWIDDVIHRGIEQECSMIVLKMVDFAVEMMAMMMLMMLQLVLLEIRMLMDDPSDKQEVFEFHHPVCQPMAKALPCSHLYSDDIDELYPSHLPHWMSGRDISSIY